MSVQPGSGQHDNLSLSRASKPQAPLALKRAAASARAVTVAGRRPGPFRARAGKRSFVTLKPF